MFTVYPLIDKIILYNISDKLFLREVCYVSFNDEKR